MVQCTVTMCWLNDFDALHPVYIAKRGGIIKTSCGRDTGWLLTEYVHMLVKENTCIAKGSFIIPYFQSYAGSWR
jgi:hypothetical protein